MEYVLDYFLGAELCYKKSVFRFMLAVARRIQQIVSTENFVSYLTVIISFHSIDEKCNQLSPVLPRVFY